MSELQVKTTTKDLFARPDIKSKFDELMGKRASSFITSVLQIVSQNALLKNAEPISVYQAAAVAATLDLPLNNNLGFAYIVPYNEKRKDEQNRDITVQVAQFQMGYKGFIQLAQRSGQFKTINCTDVREGEIKKHDRLTDEIEFEWIQDAAIRNSKPVIAYVSYFKLLNGFEKPYLIYRSELEAHAKKYSQTYKRGFGLWKDDFDGMARKTAIKLLLSKYAPLSVEMQTAVIADQAIIKDAETGAVEYADNPEYAEVIEETSIDDIKALYDLKKDKMPADEVANAERIISAKEVNSYSKLHKYLSGL